MTSPVNVNINLYFQNFGGTLVLTSSANMVVSLDSSNLTVGALTFTSQGLSLAPGAISISVPTGTTAEVTFGVSITTTTASEGVFDVSLGGSSWTGAINGASTYSSGSTALAAGTPWVILTQNAPAV